jgi:hypothetical protein
LNIIRGNSSHPATQLFRAPEHAAAALALCLLSGSVDAGPESVQCGKEFARANCARCHCYPCADRRVMRKPTNARLNQHSLNIRCVPGARMRSPYQNKCKGLTVSELVLNTFLHGEL